MRIKLGLGVGLGLGFIRNQPHGCSAVRSEIGCAAAWILYMELS